MAKPTNGSHKSQVAPKLGVRMPTTVVINLQMSHHASTANGQL
jgi:hypothetical protein